MAKEWMGAGVSIVTRLIGSTRDSTSLHLLLQSICLQLSFSYKTDPGIVPKVHAALLKLKPITFPIQPNKGSILKFPKLIVFVLTACRSQLDSAI